MSRADKNADRLFGRLVTSANRNGGGDRCHGCGRGLSSGEVALLGTDRHGDGLIVAACCRGKIDLVYGIGLFLAHRDAPPEWLATVEPQGRA